MEAAYVFRVRFTLAAWEPDQGPDEVETTVRVIAPRPGKTGWLLFRDLLWRGEVNDPSHARRVIDSRLPDGISVVAAEFREFEANESYLNALREAIRAELGQFNSESVRDVLHKYFGSAIRVR